MHVRRAERTELSCKQAEGYPDILVVADERG